MTENVELFHYIIINSRILLSYRDNLDNIVLKYEKKTFGLKSRIALKPVCGHIIDELWQSSMDGLLRIDRTWHIGNVMMYSSLKLSSFKFT